MRSRKGKSFFAGLLSLLRLRRRRRIRPHHPMRTQVIEGPALHAPTGMILPESVAGFARTSALMHDPAGMDVSAGYTRPSSDGEPPVVASVRVYPAAEPPMVDPAMTAAPVRDQEFAFRVWETRQAHPNARLIGETWTTTDQAGGPQLGRMAVFSFQEPFLDGPPRLLRAELRLFCNCHPGWTIAYRFTYPEEMNPEPFIRAFMASLVWPAMPGAPVA